MRRMLLLLTVALAGALALPLPAAEVDQLKSDLIGQCMGGREKCWMFQSREQIKKLEIKNKTEDAQKRVYTIALELQATKASRKFAAEARVEYLKLGSVWKIRHVGLLSLKRMGAS